MAFQLSSLLSSKAGMLSTSDHTSVVSMNLFVALLCGCIVIGHLLEENRWMNESITALLIGLGTGVLILLISGGKSSHLLVFSEDLFFIYLLPPIIFNAGFQVKKKQFFRNFITIVMFGALGTLVSFFIISLGAKELFTTFDIGSLDLGDYLAIGAIFAATDSVCTLQVLNQDETPLLYSLVFGEGVVNDATSVVLFNAIQNFDLTHIDHRIALQFCGNFLYLFFASTLLGAITGLLSAYVIKKLYFGRHSTDREVALMILMAYLSYILAETFIFLYVGMDALDIEKWRFVSNSPGTSVAVSSVLLGLLMLGRAAFVFPLSLLVNLSKKNPSEKISFRQQVIIWWAGLMRGAVSMALAYNQVFGLLTKPLIRFLLPHAKHFSSASTISTPDLGSPKLLTLPLLESRGDPETDGFNQDGNADHGLGRPGSLRMLLNAPTHTVHYYWRKFDDSFMRPVFGGRGFVPFVPGSPTEQSTNDLTPTS
ncbi:hypothetical protein KSS87_012495 [Heliosperma pusillum]|nr:hypothetical protein KSS87_012495 [Heliosperma pusillum]